MIYNGTTLTNSLIFGSLTPSSDHNDHIRETGTSAEPVTLNMNEYMTSGAGRYAYPTLFGAVTKFFNGSFADGTYTIEQMTTLLSLSAHDFNITIGHYGTGLYSGDHAERSYIFGTSDYALENSGLVFKVENGKKSIQNLEVIAMTDGFDFKSENNAVQLFNDNVLSPTLDPYHLAREDVAINFDGGGKVYSSFSEQQYTGYKFLELNVALAGTLLYGPRIGLGLYSLARTTGPAYFASLGQDGPLSYVNQGRSVIYGSYSGDTLSPDDFAASLFNPLPKSSYWLVGGNGDDSISGSDKSDVLEGGDDNDTLTGMDGIDSLIAGDDDDELNGGANNDHLEGGEGFDKYIFNDSFGNDSVQDSDGRGVIVINGQETNSDDVEKVSNNVYRQSSTGLIFIVDSSGSNLTIKSGNSNSITIRNWQEGDLDITLAQAQQPNTPGNFNMFLGDQRPLIYGQEVAAGTNQTNTYAWNQVTRDYSTGDLNGLSQAEENFKDVIHGTSNNDSISGLGGNDALHGAGGNDKIDGGAGDDLIGGGAGSDTISGGAGADYILGGFNLSVPQRQPTDSWSPPPGFTTVIQGANWGIYKSQTNDTQQTIQGAQLGATDDPDVINGDAGDDFILGSHGNDIIDGGADNDKITGLGGNDAIEGGDGNDSVWGDGDATPTQSHQYGYVHPSQMGNDFLNGGKGNDQLFGQGGRDSIFGDADNDKIWGDNYDAEETPEDRHDNDYLDGGSGNDSIYGGGKDDKLYGGDGNDVLLGDDAEDKVDVAIHGSDYLNGDAGHDILRGGGGDDELYGGTENDELRGDDTEDRVAVSAHGRDYLNGEEGADTLYGDGGDDTLYGGDGTDSLYGDAEQDEVATSAHGNDLLCGEKGADVLIGGGGDDMLIGGADNDTLWGDDEETQVNASAHGDDFLDGGEGTDQLVGNGGNDTLIGGAGNDKLFGDAPSEALAASAHGNDYLDGGDGDDTLIGGGGNDVLIGGDGADTLFGDGGTNELYGGAGDDLLVSTGADILDGGAGNDKYIVSFGSEGLKTLLDIDGSNEVHVDVAALDEVAWTEHLGTLSTGLSKGLASLDLTSQLYFSDAMRVNVAGQEFEHVIDLKANLAWKITGSDGNDEIIGSARSDTLSGGGGNDTLIGGAGSDDLFGDAGDDTLQGGEGEDYLVDVSGRNRLEGGAARDVLQGGDDGDTLIGGTCNDLVIGGRGDDVYEFNAGDGEDAITDLGGEDTIRFGTGLTLDNLTAIGTQDLTLTFQTGEQLHIRSGALGVIEKFEFADGRVLRVDELIRAVSPDDGLLLDAPEEGGNIFGGALHDTLQGSSGDDTLTGWAGNDVLAGGAGADTYVFQAGSGTDTVIDAGGEPNFLHFTDLVDASSLNAYLEYEGESPVLVLSRSDTGDQVRINNAQNHGIESLKLADGSVIDFASWLATQDLDRTGSDGNNRLVGQTGGDTLEGLDGADTLTGSSSADHLLGGTGDDVLIGQGGQDTYEGGAGDDAMLGGQGADEYVWGSNQGHDRIIDASAGNRIRLLPGTEQGALIFLRNGSDLQMLSADRSASVTIEDHFSRATDWTLVGADNEEASLSQLYAQSLASNAELAESQRLAAAQATFMADAATRRQAELTKMSDQYGDLAPDSLNDFDSLGIYTATGTLAGNPNTTATLIADMSTKQLASNASTIDIGGGPYWGATTLGSVTTGWVTQTNTTVVLEYIYPEPVVLRFIPADKMPAAFRHEIGEYIPVRDAQTNVLLGYEQMKLPEPGDYQVVKNFITSTTTVAQKSVTDQYDLGLTKLAAGDADNTITFNSGNFMVDAGGGDDVIRADTAPFTTLRYETEPPQGRPTFLYGNAGNDTIIGSRESDTIMGGKGDDKLNGGGGADTYQVGAQGGWDLILDSGSQHIDAYVYEGSDEDIALMNALWEANQVDGGIPFTGAMLATFLSFKYSRDEDSVVRVRYPNGDFEKWIGPEDEPWSLHLNGIPLANDQDWLALTYDTNEIPLDTIEFGEGIDLSDLALSYGSQTIAGRTYRTLDIGFPDGGGTHVVLAESNDAIGFGVERFRFADGSVMTLADMLYQIPIVGTAAGDRMAPVDRRNRLQGGEGNDTYILNSRLQSEVIEEIGGGIDTIETNLPDFDLRNHANVENLKLTANLPDEYGSSLIGNELNNVITGANSDDFIQGGAGNDELIGKDGDDWLEGEDGNDTLFGGVGLQTLIGGSGDDLYYVDDGGVVVIEELDEGIDTVSTTLSEYVLPGHVENLIMNGKAEVNTSSGNALDNYIEGTWVDAHISGLDGNDILISYDGNDTLDGGLGHDILEGGTGDDIYYVDQTLMANDEYLIDEVLEFDGSNGGIDTVYTDIGDYVLPSHVENLVMTGKSAYGNELDNHITGSDDSNQVDAGAGHDTLIGLDGDDWLIGGEGNDEYEGGAGDDTLVDDAGNEHYTWGRGEGTDSISDGGGSDQLHILAGVDSDQIWLRQNGQALELQVIGTHDRLLIDGWFLDPLYQIESFELADGKTLNASNVQALVSAMAAFTPPPLGQTTLTTQQQADLGQVIASNWT